MTTTKYPYYRPRPQRTTLSACVQLALMQGSGEAKRPGYLLRPSWCPMLAWNRRLVRKLIGWCQR